MTRVLSTICLGLCLLTGVALVIQDRGLYAIWPIVLSVFFAGSIVTRDKQREGDE